MDGQWIERDRRASCQGKPSADRFRPLRAGRAAGQSIEMEPPLPKPDRHALFDAVRRDTDAYRAVVLALVVYLTYLRRTVRIEAEIRRRRTARLERARREREREAEVLDGVPAHLRRGGCVVMEIDDEDPAFDHLPRYRAEEFDFLRNSSELREPLERKVG